MDRHRSLALFPLAGSSIPLWFIPLLLIPWQQVAVSLPTPLS